VPSSTATLPGSLGRPRQGGSAVVQAMTFDGADACFSRSADAVALVPAEQQCDETLRGGRTQLDVDGTVTGHRL
jgi:hypothetical protein